MIDWLIRRLLGDEDQLRIDVLAWWAKCDREDQA